MKKLTLWTGNAQRPQAALAIGMLAKRWGDKLGSELLVLVLSNIKEGHESLARFNIGQFQLIAEGLSKEDIALLQSAVAGLQGTSWGRFSVATLRAVAVSCCKFLLGEVDPESWTARNGPTKQKRNRYPCPKNDDSIVPR
jgi:hypothetical protein